MQTFLATALTVTSLVCIALGSLTYSLPGIGAGVLCALTAVVISGKG